jgi:hypothetical protein
LPWPNAGRLPKNSGAMTNGAISKRTEPILPGLFLYSTEIASGEDL